MKLRSFTHLLLLLLTFQSAASWTDIHTAHQSAVVQTFEDHHYTHHEHDTDSINFSEVNQHDCSHCGHCHGHFTLAIAQFLACGALKTSKNSSLILGYSDAVFPDWYEVFLRPPIR